MRIAIDCRILDLPQPGEGFQALSLVRGLLNLPGSHRFFLVFDRRPAAKWHGFANAQCLELKPEANTAATRALWYDFRLPVLLNQQQIDLFIGTAGYISLRTTTKQILLLHDVWSGKNCPAQTGWRSKWYPGRLSAMLKKANLITTASVAQLHSALPTAAKYPILFLPFCPVAANTSGTGHEERDKIKESLTDGAEYFVCRDGWQTLDGAIEMLLAFSAFKKRMLSGMKLVLLGQGPTEKEWAEKLQTFRYREDVVLVSGMGGQPHPEQIIACAWALIHLPGGALLGALQTAICAGVPVIALPQNAVLEIAGDTALYCRDLPGETLSQNLMRIYKDEKMRAALIKAGLEQSLDWTPERAARQLLEAALKLV